jgi:tRNA (cmo5U34)-methyltransferase
MPDLTDANEWTSREHATAYLARADQIPHRTEGEGVMLDHVRRDVRRILDLGTGDGRLLGLLKIDRPRAHAVALDFSPTMLAAARQRFSTDLCVEVVEHDLALPLPDLGTFDAVVSSFAIHHLPHERKYALYAEIFATLAPGGIFCNLEHVSSPTPAMHRHFYRSIGQDPEHEDPSNKLLDVETQLGWLREIGFLDVDCYWKWLELALLIGYKTGGVEGLSAAPDR